MKKFNNFILEKATDILYHFTNIRRLKNILETNKLYLTSSIGSVADNNKNNNKMYFFSLTRTKSIKHGYGNRFSFDGAVRIKFDGKKLNYNNKIINIDYWNAPRDVKSMINNTSLDEMEERLISNKDEIKNINEYIISIDILNSKKELYKDIIENAKKLNIEINFYDDEKYFNSGNKNRKISPKEIIDDDDYKSLDYIYKIGALYIVKDIENEKKLYDYLTGEYSDKELYSIKNRIIDYEKHIKYQNRVFARDLENSIGADIHNMRSTTNIISRNILKMLSDDMVKHNTKTIKEYLEYKLYIGKTTQKQFNDDINKKMKKYVDDYLNKILSSSKYNSYDKNGDFINNYYNIPEIKKYLKSTFSAIKTKLSEMIISDNEFFKYNYIYNLKSNDNFLKIIDFDKIFDLIDGTEIWKDDISDTIKFFLYDLGEFLQDEMYLVIKKYENEWYNN